MERLALYDRLTLLMGSAADFAQNGVIASLGVVQCQRPGDRYQGLMSTPPYHEQCIWAAPDLFLPTSSSTGTNYSLKPMAYLDKSLTTAFNTYYVLNWVHAPTELEKLDRITAGISTAPGDDGILGLRSSYIRRYWAPKRSVGFSDKGNLEELSDTRVVHFDVDGPGGERIVEVRAQRSDGRVKAIMVCRLLYLL